MASTDTLNGKGPAGARALGNHRGYVASTGRPPEWAKSKRNLPHKAASKQSDASKSVDTSWEPSRDSTPLNEPSF